MKFKTLICMIIVSICFLMTSCEIIGNLNTISVSTIKDWHFQYNEGTSDYSLFFGLINNDGKYISANAIVEIRIEDEKII